MTNLEWLYSLEPKELSEWFAAEHVEGCEVSYYDKIRFFNALATASNTITGDHKLGEKTYNKLVANGCRTLCSLGYYSDEDLRRINGLGEKMLECIRLAQRVVK